MGERFEALARDKFQVKHAFAVCNGTCGLQAALAAVGAGPGTEIIVPGAGFIATALAGAMLGATPSSMGTSATKSWWMRSSPATGRTM